MFIPFFYLLRRRGIHISPGEWMTLMEALEKGLHHSGLTGFYHVCRAVLVHNEADFDRFDQAFLEYFREIPLQGQPGEKDPDWFARMMEAASSEDREGEQEDPAEQDREKLREWMGAQNGTYWIDGGEAMPAGRSAMPQGGIRLGGVTGARTAIAVAGDRIYRDFRKDQVLNIRQFQMAFRLLRQYSAQENPEEEFDIDGTIQDTGRNGGLLKIRMKKPRKNTIKILLMMDSGGSMDSFLDLSARLFQAATASRHLKELQIFYFHNCIYDRVFKSPVQKSSDAVKLEKILKDYDETYRLILMGDAEMAPYEYFGNSAFGMDNASGEGTLRRLKRHYPHLIWLNPEPMPQYLDYSSETHLHIASLVPMYELTLEGMQQGLKHLLARR